jgi:hypothetical protein
VFSYCRVCSLTVECVLLQVFQDMSQDHAKKTVTIDPHPHMSGKRTHSIAREHILSSENTFYSKRTHSIVRQHIYCQRTYSIVREHILLSENTFYSKRTHLWTQHILLSENTLHSKRTHSMIHNTFSCQRTHSK